MESVYYEESMQKKHFLHQNKIVLTHSSMSKLSEVWDTRKAKNISHKESPWSLLKLLQKQTSDP